MFSNANLDHLENSIEALELRGQRRKILILLAAYNGEKYLSEQIKSIQGQTISNWTLVIRDDGSDDNSKILSRTLLLGTPVYVSSMMNASAGERLRTSMR